MGLRVRMFEARVLASLALAAIGCGDEGVAAPSEDSAVADAGSADAAPPDDAGDAPSDAAVLVPLPTRGAGQHCVLHGTPSDALPRVELERAEGARFERAVQVLARLSEPDALYVVEQGGQLARFEPDAEAPARQVLLDMSSVLVGEGASLLGAAFHPDYDDNGLIFVHYVSGTPLRSVVASFRVDAATGQAPLISERRVLAVTHPGEGRNGGALLFDGDGMLLVALGDGGDAALGTTRDPLLGSILRLAVTADDVPGYAIPPDNPFASPDEPGERPPEVLAYGFADPSACHIDPAEGQLWCVDRGRLYSELNAVQRGRDHGWPAVENVICVATQELCLDNGTETPPLGYLHVEGLCGAIGAVPMVAPSELEGSVIYADACTGAIRGLGVRGEHDRKRSAIGGTGSAIGALGRDASGALVLIDGEGALLRARVSQDELPGTFPERLSETGCFTGPELRDPAPDLVPFDVRSPLWSDGTHKRRYMVLPAGARIATSDDGPWEFPTGAIMVKEFALPFDDLDPSSVRPIETRFMVRRAGGWEFHSFRWNDERTDAVRVQDDVKVDFEVMRGGHPYTQRYLYPSSETCPVCHSSSPGRVLGPRTEQLNFEVPYEGGAQNQLEALAALALFDNVPGEQASLELDALPRLPDPRDQTLPLEPRVRSYLQANCAHCHQPGGYSSPDLVMDLRFSRTLAETNICDREPQFFNDAPKLIAPGDPEGSALLVRMLATDIDRMPPVATSEVDPLGAVLLTRWIQQLTECPLVP